MAGFTNRLKNILNSVKAKVSTDRLIALQELAEILAVSTEDTLAGYFQTDSFSWELISILKGDQQNNNNNEDHEDELLVAALAASVDNQNNGNGQDVEQMLLASRCLANLMEALPGSAHTVVHHEAVPVLCVKLLKNQPYQSGWTIS